VDVIERVIKFGCEPARGMKQTWRMKNKEFVKEKVF
jgi:hypothetical protein